MENEPLESDDLLRIAGRMARFGGWSVDLANGLVLWSDEVCAIHDEAPGTTVSVEEGIGYYAPEWQPVIREHFTACVEEGIPYDLDLELVTRKGRRVWVRSIGEPVLGPEGKVVRVQGAFQDLSALKEKEDRMRALEGRLVRILENLPDGFLTFDHEWRFTFLNQTAADYYGRPREELLGKVVWDEYPEVVDTPFYEEYQRAAREGKAVRFEAFYEPWGKWLREHVYPVDEGVVSYFQDITEWREAEEARQESETLLRQLADHIESVFWVSFEDRSRLEYVSPAYGKVWGRDRDELYENPRAWLEAVHDQDRERVRHILSLGWNESFELEFRIVRPDGSIRWIRDRIFPLRDDEGEVYRTLGVAEDITERKELQEQVRHGQKLEVVGQLAGGVAHDFNNLLTVIQASSEMLIEDLPSDSPLRAITEEIRGQAERGAKLTRQLLAFSRRQVLHERVLDLGRFLDGIQPILRRVISSNIEIEWRESTEASPVKADPDQLQQIILNLVVNAVDAIEGHGRITLEVDTIRLSPEDAEGLPWTVTPGEYVRLTVRDTGSGMSPEVMDRLFEPFFTTKPVGRGTGLGLPMVYGVVKQSDGHILVESEPGEGSTFQVLLPIVDADRAGGSGPEPALPPRGHLGTGVVLVVEDDDAVREATARMLERSGYRVLKAGGGNEALELLDRQPGAIDVVLSDLVMPDLDGVMLLDRLRKLRPGLPVVLMSGYSAKEHTAEARQKATAFLEKPFSPEDLVRAIRTALGSPQPRPPRDRA